MKTTVIAAFLENRWWYVYMHGASGICCSVSGIMLRMLYKASILCTHRGIRATWNLQDVMTQGIRQLPKRTGYNVCACVTTFISRTPRAKMCRVGKDCNAKAAWNVHSFVTCRMFRVVCEYFHGAFDGDKEIFDGTRAVEMKERVCVCVCVSKSSFACGMISAGSSCVRRWQAERVREVCNSVNTSALRCSICPVHSTLYVCVIELFLFVGKNSTDPIDIRYSNLRGTFSFACGIRTDVLI
jgi:hypothetical protein